MDLDSNLPNAASPKDQLNFKLPELPEQYEILGCISEGGMGTILKAQNRYTKALVAIKVMRLESVHNKTDVQRFFVEAKAAHSLKHPNICQVHDFGVTKDGMPYLVMDWIHGISLQKMIEHSKRLSSAQALPIFQQVVAALGHANQHHVVHRDLKPDNIMLSVDTNGLANVHLVDFGVAKVLSGEVRGTDLTRAGITVGTPMYMSPEQARGDSIDQRTDIYSLGCVMYFTLTGQPPFTGNTVMDTMTKQLTEPTPSIDSTLQIQSDLQMIIFKCMEKNRDDRYHSMEQLAADLKKLTKEASVERHVHPSEKQSRQRKIIFVAYFILAFLIAYALSVAVQGILDAQDSNSHKKIPAKMISQ